METARRYRIHEALGKGGFGTVYRGEVLGVGGFSKLVAIKVLNAEVAARADVARRLRDEARMLGLLQHRAIIGVDGLVDLGDRWAVVMEFVEGVDLGVCLRLAPVPPGPALEIAQEVAAALDAAWSQLGSDGRPLRLLHRDIKPGNIRITGHGDVKLLDFGIARADYEGREAETHSMRFGSIHYMSPERIDLAEGKETHASDVYALGVTLFEALTGLTYGKASLDEPTHRSRVSAALEKAREFVDDSDVLSLLEDALAYSIDQRPTAREFEKRARRLARRFEPDLRDWAEHGVPAAAALVETFTDELSGTIVGHSAPWDREALTAAEELPARRPGSTGALLAGGAAIPMVGCALLGLVGLIGTLVVYAIGPVSSEGGALLAGTHEEQGPLPGSPEPEANALAHPSFVDERPSGAGLEEASGVGNSSVSTEAALDQTSPDTTDAGSSGTSLVTAEVALHEAPSVRRVSPDDDREGQGHPSARGATRTTSQRAPDAPLSTGESSPSTRDAVVAGKSTALSDRADESRVEKSATRTGTVVLVGDVDRVQLASDDGTFPLGHVPSGTYRVMADFGDGPVRAGSLEVEPERVYTLSCVAAFATCTPR